MGPVQAALRASVTLAIALSSGVLFAQEVSRDPVSHWPAGYAVIQDVQSNVAPSVQRSDSAPAPAEEGSTGLLDMDIEQLRRTPVAPALEMEVSTVSRQESTVGRSPAAVFVVTQEMIRRSGATTVPEVLRTVPGLQVARIDSRIWAVSSRGFNNRLANKLLVQIDGRSVYSTRNAGVLWHIRDVVLQDVQRIEVIRGPGATIWGANAVNGVINIITKSAKNTQGALLSAGGGTEERGFSTLRYGAKAGNNLHYRVYGKHFERDDGFSQDAMGADDWRELRTGFRADWEPNGCDTITLQGDYFDVTSGKREIRPTLNGPPFAFTNVEDVDTLGGNVLCRWTHELGEDADWALQFYYDRFSLQGRVFSVALDAYDLDFQHRFPLSARQKLIYGFGYRLLHSDGVPGSDFDNGFAFGREEPRNVNLFTTFVQDEITLVEDRLYGILGSKFEHNDFSGFEYQPTARLLWLPSPRDAAWAAVSRAVRTPSFSDDDIRLTSVPSDPNAPSFGRVTGSRDFVSEDLLAFELGYRAQPLDEFYWDLALFFNKYTDLRVSVPGTPFAGPPPATILPLIRDNGMHGETYGAELAATWELTECWQLYGQYTFLQMQLHRDPGIGAAAEGDEGRSPHNQVYLRSSWDLAWQWELDLIGRYVDELPTLNVPSYIETDVRLAWHPNRRLEVAVVGQNLLDSHHLEFGTGTLIQNVNVEAERGVYAMATWER